MRENDAETRYRTSESAGDGGRWPRRKVLSFLAAAGLGNAVFHRALVTVAAESPALTAEMIDRAEWISGIDFDKQERELMLDGVNELLEGFAELRRIPLPNDVPPAIRFEVLGASRAEGGGKPVALPPAAPRSAVRPASEEELAFGSVRDLAALLRARRISSSELTRAYLDRLRRHDPVLKCVTEYTEALALDQAARADREIARGDYRGPLHGIPWGAKDLLAVPGYRTTWGATPFKDQTIDETSTVAARMDRAGAVLLAKLTVGALAWGDVWYGGTTKNPWNTEQGSSGSSAGPAAAAAAGLAGFTIGTETWGSIVSPCTRCGVSGLRPTFGRVSRHGAMALSWSMDKIGPIARTVEDCALVFHALAGPDGLDPTVVDRPFAWPPRRDVRKLRVGFVESLFRKDRGADAESDEDRALAREWQSFDDRTLDTLRGTGIELVPVRLPEKLPVEALSFILTAEAATAFDELTRSGRDDFLVRQVEQAWPNVFRQGQLIPAVEYLRANRIRTLLMREMERTTMAEIDVYVSPTFAGNNLLLTNLTGHPQVVLPNGFRQSDGTPTSITFTGRLFGETDLLALADAYQRATDFHLKRPPLFGAP